MSRTNLRPLALLLAGAALLTACGPEEEKAPKGLAIRSFEVTPEHLTEAGEVTVAWRTSGAASLDLLQGDLPLLVEEARIARGSMDVQVQVKTTFVLTAKDAAGREVKASRTVTVDVPPGPSIAVFRGSEVVQADEAGEAMATLTWAGVERARELSLLAPGREPIELDAEAGEGSLDVRLSEDTIFELVAKNEEGQTSRSAEVRVAYLPEIVRFEAERDLVGVAETSRVHWATAGAERVELWQDGVRIEGVGAPEGSLDVVFTWSSALELRVFNELGAETTASLEIEVGAPVILDFQIGATSLWMGEATTFGWRTRGGSGLALTMDGSGEPLCVEAERGTIETSSCTWRPIDPGVYPLTLAVSNASGVATASAEIFAANGPMITRFDARPTSLNAGEDLEIVWVVREDPAGNVPSLRLTNDPGGSYPADTPTGNHHTRLTEPGTYELQLEATTHHPSSSPDRATASVVVYALPAVEFIATPPLFDEAEDDEVVLSWTTRDAEGLVLYRMVDGSPVKILEALGAERGAGSYRFAPEADERFRLVATNSIGGTTTRDLEVALAATEVRTVEAAPTAFTQGQTIRLSWRARMADQVTIDAATRGYLLEETTAPYLDLPNLGGSHLPMTENCGVIDPLGTPGCTELTFPSDFTFPFGERHHSKVWVYTEGAIGFTAGAYPDVNALNQRFPTERRLATVSLAPFWDSLGWDYARYPTGNIYTALIEEDGERSFVIQWRDVGYSSFNWRTASFNFEVVLREDGSFDFRYGELSARDTAITNLYLTGGSATIGFQLPDQSDAGVILHDGAPSINGSPAGRTFSYRPLPALPLVGELVFSPLGRQEDFPITISAHRGDVSHSKSVSLEVARRPILELTPEEVAPAPIGAEFRVGWRSTNAVSLVVVDGAGAIRCTASSRIQIDEGLCALSEDTPGRHVYTVRAIGAHEAVAERSVAVDVFGAFGVVSFTADADSIEKGADVLVRWEVFQADSVTLYAGATALFTDPTGAPSGSFLLTGVEQATELRLVVSNHVGVLDEASIQVGLWELVIGLQASATTVRPGDPITLDFDAHTLDGGVPVKVYGLLPLREVPGSADRYADISALHQAVDLGSSSNSVDVSLPESFVFPYMGQHHRWLRAFVDGYVSFDPSAVAANSNQDLPTAVSAGARMHLAPFWDDLNPRNLGRMHTALTSDDTFVIQWSKMSLERGSTVNAPHDLNFQLVLRRDGSFDFRYGTMAPHPTHRPASGCFPNDCTNEVNGSAATIGYQFADGTAGHGYHFGGTNPAAGNPPVPGGLSGRTLRYQTIHGSGSLTFHPHQSETFTFCADAAGGPVCKELRVEVPFGVRSTILSKGEIDFGESVTLSWESVGGKILNVLDGERVVYTTSDPAEIDRGSAVLLPTQDITYVVELLAGKRKDRLQRQIEVRRASMTASATSSTGPGSPVILSWNLARLDPSLALHVAAPMEKISNTDFHEYDISGDPDVMELIGANSDNRNVTLPFVDFSFPFFGAEQSSIRVATDGYLSWETAATSMPSNQPIPSTTAAYASKAIAPFWEDLHTRRDGRVIAKKIDADRYVIQWSEVSLRWGSSETNQGNLNFLVVLHRDGRFEFRYGNMLPPPLPGSATDCHPSSCELESNGSSATIGYQTPGGGAGNQLHFGGTQRAAGQEPVLGGLSFRAWRFTLHTATGSAEIQPTGAARYKVCAYDPASGQVTCAPTLVVNVPWGIDLFQVNPTAPRAGDPVTLSWSVQGLDRLRVLANGVELARHDAPSIPQLGSLPDTPRGTTIYALEGTSMGRTVTQTRVVKERAFDLTVTGPSGTFFPGDVVEVHWELQQLLPGDVAMITPMSEVPVGTAGEDTFVDVSTFPEAVEIHLSNPSGYAAVPLPFTFPYLGTPWNVVDVWAQGYLSFVPSFANGNPNNTPFPGAVNLVQIAPFWDDMIQRAGDSIWRYSPAPDTQIIQWKRFSRTAGSSGTVHYDLNFQVVLRSDGSFDFRYGVMAPPPPPFSDGGCSPSSCANEANGSSATIGYQSIDAAYGSNLHVGSLDFVAETALAFPGGLSHRSFRYRPASVGSARIVVGRTGAVEVCGILGDFAECRSVPIDVVAEPGDLLITELMIDPAVGAAGQWIEVRNLTDHAIDMQGLELRSAAGSHRIASPVPVPPRGFVTLASSTQLPFTPTYVYGGDVPLNRLLDRLELVAGPTPITSVGWGLDWVVPRDRVLSLDPSFHLGGFPATSHFGSWCPSSGGSPGTLGAGCVSEWYDVDPHSDRPFIDITSTGNRLPDLELGNTLVRLPSTGFRVKHFGEGYTRLWIATNGWISLSETVPTSTPALIPILGAPTALPRMAAEPKGPLIAPFWNRLSCGGACQVHYERREIAGEDVLILQWQDFQVEGAAALARISFQVQLWAGGDVVVAFDALENPRRQGVDAWVGLEGAELGVFRTAHHHRPLDLHHRSFYFRAK